MDYYRALGVSRDAPEKEIKAAFRKLARQYHPDVNPGDKAAEARFKAANEAYEVLSDRDKRRLYDTYGSDWQAAQAAGAGAQAAAGGGPRVRYRTASTGPEDFGNLFGDQEHLADLFQNLFGEAGRTTERRRAPSEMRGAISVSFREAYSGATRTVELPDGRRLEVTIPPGVTSGTVLRVPGLLAEVEVRPDPQFELEGKNLRTEVKVPLKTALLGGEVDVPTPRGNNVKLRIPPETQNGCRLRLRGLGMPGTPPGDLYAEVKIELPLPMDPGTRAWAESLP